MTYAPSPSGRIGRLGFTGPRARSSAALLCLFSVFALLLGVIELARPADAATPASVLGVYAGPASPGTVSAVGTALGYHPTYAMDFLDPASWSTISNPSWFLGQWQGSGYKMIWGVEMIPNSGGSLAAGATGAYDAYFKTLAQNLVTGGQGSSVIRLGWEFNGGWFPWAANGHAADFVTYWQHIVTAMRSVAGASFRFEWNPTRGDMGVGDLANYYPGDTYVDIVGLDVYDTEWASYPGAQAEWQTMQTQAYGLNWLASFAGQHNKPISFPEWGLGWGPSATNSGPVQAAGQQVSGGDDPTFIANMGQWIANHNVDDAVFWDYGTSTILGGSNPKTTAALTSAFATGASGGSTTTLTPSTAPTTNTVTAPPPTTSAAAVPPTTSPATTTSPTTSRTTTSLPATTASPTTTRPPSTTSTTLRTSPTTTTPARPPRPRRSGRYRH